MNRQDLQNLAEAYAQISEKKKDDSYLETDMKKRQANNEKARKDMEKMGTSMKNPHFEQYTVTNADKKGNTKAYQNFKAGMKKKDGTPMYKAADHMKEGVRDLDPEKGTAERKARLEKKRGMKMDDHPQYKKEEVEQVAEADSLAAMAARREKRLAAQRKREGTTASGRDFGHDYSLSDKQQKARRDAEFKAGMKKEEVEAVDEAMSSYDRNRKRAAQRAAERNAARAAGKTGVVPGVGYVSPRKERETYVDSAGITRHKSGAKMPRKESYDAMAKEYVTEILGAVGPAAAGVIGGTAGAVTGGKKKVKRAVATGTGAAAGAALGGPVGALIGGVAGRALS